jgi:hypothetical protein
LFVFAISSFFDASSRAGLIIKKSASSAGLIIKKSASSADFGIEKK